MIKSDIKHLRDIFKNDINWRDISEDKSVFLPENAKREILVEDKYAIRVDYAYHINSNDHVSRATNEEVLRYAFLN